MFKKNIENELIKMVFQLEKEKHKQNRGTYLFNVIEIFSKLPCDDVGHAFSCY